MFPYIEIGSIKIYMTGLGMVIFLISFVLGVNYYSRRYKLDSGIFLQKFPLYLIITYLLGTYVHYLIRDLVVFPLDREYFLLYLSPREYSFHFIGIMVGMLLSGILFLKAIPTRYEKQRRVDTLCHALMVSLIPLGIFLLLGDDLIGATTQGSFYISAMIADSAVAAYDKVIPLGLYLSLLGLIGNILLTYRERHRSKGFGYLGLSFLVFGIGIILIWQQYPRRFVTSVGSIILDINQYIAFLLAAALFVKFLQRHQ